VQARVVDRDRGARRQRLGERRSYSSKRRPDSALTNVTVPMVRSRTRIGAIITDDMPSSRMMRSVLGVARSGGDHLAGDLGVQLGAAGTQDAVQGGRLRIGRILAPQPIGECDLLRVRVRHGDWRTSPSSPTRSTPHQSAISGTASCAALRRVCS
jgi:hypothetical protein